MSMNTFRMGALLAASAAAIGAAELIGSLSGREKSPESLHHHLRSIDGGSLAEPWRSLA